MSNAYRIIYEPLDLRIKIGDEMATVTFISCLSCGALIHSDNTSLHTQYHANRQEGEQV